MKMKKRNFRIGELADHLGLERFVIRFWEKEFNIKGQRSDGGQRFYQEKDIQKFETIKSLLYDQGFTIAGAKKYMKENGTKKPQTPAKNIVASQVTTMETPAPEIEEIALPEVIEVAAPVETKPYISELSPDIAQQILALQAKLLKLKELL